MLLYPANLPGGLSGAAWGTQDSNGVWSGWANPAPQQVAAYDPGAGAAFGGAADAYMGDPNAYAAQMPAPVPVSQPAAGGMSPVGGASFGGGGATFGGAAPAPMAGDMSAGGSTAFNGGPGGYGFASGAGGPGVGNTGGMPRNPYLPDIAGDITRRSTDMMNAGIRQARGAAIMAGGFGGTGQGLLENAAIKGSVDNLAGQLGNLYGSAWNQDQSRDLQRYAADQGFFTAQRGQDLQSVGLGASLLGQGVNLPWSPIQNAGDIARVFSGLNATESKLGQSGNWESILGGLLSGARFGRDMKWL